MHHLLFLSCVLAFCMHRIVLDEDAASQWCRLSSRGFCVDRHAGNVLGTFQENVLQATS